MLKNRSILEKPLVFFLLTIIHFGSSDAKKKETVNEKQSRAESLGLVEVQNVVPKVVLDIKYATENNFMGRRIYSQAKCYVRQCVARKLLNVQRELMSQGLGLKITDGYRPHRAQYKLWEFCPILGYVADPKQGSNHNRGCAVDVTLVRLSDGEELVMPSEIDELSEKAHRDYTAMTLEAAKNCKLLEEVMVKNGFMPLWTEWWHFADVTSELYDVLDFSFEELEELV